jgi:hypothetical protein
MSKRRFKLFFVPSLALLLSSCGIAELDYQAIYQVVPDARVLALGSHTYLASDTNNSVFLVELDDNSELIQVRKLF